MLYLDYSRRDGEWLPNPDGSNDNRDAVAFLRRVNELVYGGFPGAVTIAEESTAWPGVSRRPMPAASASASSGTWAGCTTRSTTWRSDPVHRRWHHDQDDLRPALRLQREFRAADVARRGGARQRLDPRPDAGRRMAAVRQRRAPITASCGAIPARSCCSWARSSARRANGTRRSRCPGGCSSIGRIRACRRWSATSTGSIARRRRCMRATARRRDSAGSSSTTTRQSVFAFLRPRRGERSAGRSRLQLHPGAAP